MGVINRPNTYTANTTISPSGVNDDFDTIYNEFNGNIAAANLATNAITTAKIADLAVTTAKLADDSVTAAKLQYGFLRNRQGGTSGAGSYQTAGTTNTDTSATNVFYQAGSAVTSAGEVVITFPTIFTQIPLVFATVNSAAAANCFVRVTAQTTANATLTIITDGGALGSAEVVNWLAIGQ